MSNVGQRLIASLTKFRDDVKAAGSLSKYLEKKPASYMRRCSCGNFRAEGDVIRAKGDVIMNWQGVPTKGNVMVCMECGRSYRIGSKGEQS